MQDTNRQITFYSDEDPSVKFVISKNMALTSSLFTTMLDTSMNSYNYQLSMLDYKENTNTRSYKINTVKLLKYIHEYFKLWEENLNGCDYVKEKPIQTGDVRQVLKSVDIEYIEKYLLTELNTNNTIDKEKYNSDVNYKRISDIEMLGYLLSQCDEYLGIKSLSNKIYAWIAVQLWNTSIVDFHLATGDPIFETMQNEAISEWKEQHIDRITSRISKC